MLGTVPKDLTPSDLIDGAAAGDEDIGAEASSIDPKVTAEPGTRHQELTITGKDNGNPEADLVLLLLRYFEGR